MEGGRERKSPNRNRSVLCIGDWIRLDLEELEIWEKMTRPLHILCER